MRIKVTVEQKHGYFEVWHITYDDKGKEIGKRQQGVAVHGPTPEDFWRALALMDPFRDG